MSRYHPNRREAHTQKEDAIVAEGMLLEALGGGRWRVRLDDVEHSPICLPSGKLRKFRIRLAIGDRVRVELSPYDLTRGRLTYRL